MSPRGEIGQSETCQGGAPQTGGRAASAFPGPRKRGDDYGRAHDGEDG